MAFAAYLPENAILVLSLGGAFSPFFKAPPWGFLYKPPGPTVGHLQLFQTKMTNAEGGWVGWARLELTES